MSTEFWTIIGVGVALAGLQWRLYGSLNGRMDRIETRMDRLETRMDRIEARLNEMGQRLSRLEGQVELLLRGLHIEIRGEGA